MGSSTTYTAIGSTSDSETDNEVIAVLGSMSYTTGALGGPATVTSFDAHLSVQSGSDVLTIQNGHSSVWNGITETVTTSGNQVFVNGTLLGTYSFSNQDLTFSFGSGNSDPKTLGAILDAIAYQNTATVRPAETETVSLSFGASRGGASAPSTTVNVRSLVTPVTDPAQILFSAGGSTMLTTYAGSPVFILPNAFVSGTTTGASFDRHGVRTGYWTVRETAVTVTIVNPHAGDRLLSSNTIAGANVAVSPDGTEILLTVGPQSDSGGPVFTAFLQSIQYENTSGAPPSSAQIQISFGPGTLVAGSGQGPVSVPSPSIVTVNLTPLPTVVTETATVTSGAAVAGTAGTTGTGALAGDSDANGYSLTISAVTGGTLGFALHGSYGDLVLNADGSFTYAAGVTAAETTNIAAASGPVTDAFTYSVSDGHGGIKAATLDVNLDAAKPSIASIGFSPASGDLAPGATGTITLSMSKMGTIDTSKGAPTLALNDNGTATYNAAKSTATSLVFDYAVASTDTDVTSLAIKTVNLNGTTLQNPSGVATTTSLSVSGLTQAGPQVDTTIPAFTGIVETPPSGVLIPGDSVTFTLSTNDPVTVDTTKGAPTLKLNDNGTATYNAAKSTSTSLVFDYLVLSTDTHVASLAANSFNANGAVIQNGAGTPATLSIAGLAQIGPDIEVGPTVTGAMAAPSSGDFTPGATVTIFLEMSKAVTVTGSTATLSLNNGGTATLDVADTAAFERFGLVAFDYKVLAGDHDSSALAITSINPHGTSIADGVGIPANFSNGLFQLPNIRITDATPCYCPGTLIATDRGEIVVEALAIGDRVMTMSGVLRPIKWIGRRSFSGRFVIGCSDILPVCIKAGALDENVPRRDLWISPHHAMYLEGVLIEAKDLVNGVSIVQAERVEKVEYFHIELETHDVIIAEGSLSESFVDDDSRGMFHNAQEYRVLYPDAPDASVRYCTPRRDGGYEVEAARQRIDARAGLRPAAGAARPTLRGHVDVVNQHRISGWAQNTRHPEAPVCLDIFAGGRLIGQTLANRYRADLARAGLGSGNHSFEFTPPAGLGFAPHAVEVRRSLDGMALGLSIDARRALADITTERMRAVSV